jgi:2-polyprenyl-6-hydroxyphenyl methylase/3-demethylubiquinone-9 3-methyltransferase
MAVATINRTPKSFLFAIVGAEYVLRWLPRGTHRWDRFVKPAEVERLLERGGLRIADRTGVRVNPMTRAFSLVGDLSVNFMIYATREVAA